MNTDSIISECRTLLDDAVRELFGVTPVATKTYSTEEMPSDSVILGTDKYIGKRAVDLYSGSIVDFFVASFEQMLSEFRKALLPDDPLYRLYEPLCTVVALIEKPLELEYLLTMGVLLKPTRRSVAVTYRGRRPELKDKKALARASTNYQCLLIQMDDLVHMHAHGWHEYPARDWRILENAR